MHRHVKTSAMVFFTGNQSFSKKKLCTFKKNNFSLNQVWDEENTLIPLLHRLRCRTDIVCMLPYKKWSFSIF